MKKTCFALLLLFFVCTLKIQAQSIPDAAQDSLKKMYTDIGMQLEKSFLPNFNIAHPNNLYWDTNCFPGKKIAVVTLLAKKPDDWYFKVSYGDQVAPKTHMLTELDINGNTYWTNYIITAFNASFNDYSEYCLTIVAYDKNDIDLPVYTYIFSFLD